MNVHYSICYVFLSIKGSLYQIIPSILNPDILIRIYWLLQIIQNTQCVAVVSEDRLNTEQKQKDFIHMRATIVLSIRSNRFMNSFKIRKLINIC